MTQEVDIYRKTQLFIKKSMAQNVMTMICGNIVIIKESRNFSIKKLALRVLHEKIL